MTLEWGAILLTAVGCFALKYVGVSVPRRVLEHPLTARATTLLPAGLLGALIAVQVFATDGRVEVDARLLALGVAAVLLALRVPFLPMVVAAALVAALVRQL